MEYVKEEDLLELNVRRQADKVTVKCFKCGKTFDKQFINAVNNIKKYSHIYCTKCMHSVQSERIDWDARNKKTKEVLEQKYGSVEEAYQKRNETTEKVWLEKYGVKHAWQAESVKEKIKQTSLERYGVTNAGGSKESLEKIKQTSLEHYGVDNPWKSDEIKEKTKKTMLERYGVEYFTQTPEYQKKAKKRYTYENVSFDSSWELAFYIYNKDNNQNIIRCTKGFPYTGNDGSSHMYYPDFEIDGMYYEIKGGQFFTEGVFDGGIYKTESYDCKVKCMNDNNIELVTDVTKYLNYIKSKYGKGYLSQFRNK